MPDDDDWGIIFAEHCCLFILSLPECKLRFECQLCKSINETFLLTHLQNSAVQVSRLVKPSMKCTQMNIINLEITLLRVVIKQQNLQHFLEFAAQICAFMLSIHLVASCRRSLLSWWHEGVASTHGHHLTP